MEIVVLKQAKRELKDAPKDIAEDIFALFEDLADGKALALPISRPLPSISRGLTSFVSQVGKASFVCFT